MTESDSNRARGVALLFAVFLFGALAGASLFYVGQRSVGGARPEPLPPPPGPRPLHPLDRMTRELNLDAEQERAIGDLLEKHRDAMESQLEQSREAIRQVLTEEQRERFDNMRPPRPEDRPELRGGPPGGPPPPPGAPYPPPGPRRPPRRPPPGSP